MAAEVEQFARDKGGVADLAALLLFQPVAAVILRTCMHQTQAAKANTAPLAIRQLVTSTWKVHGFPTITKDDFEKALDFLKDHELIKVIRNSPEACVITDYGQQVGAKLWAAYFAFLSAS